MSDALQFYKKDELVPARDLTRKALWAELQIKSSMVKAALARATLPEVIGRNDTTLPDGRVIVHATYTADFRDKKNLRFFDRFYMPRIREVVGEGQAKGMTTAIRDIFTPQGLYAVQLGRVARFSFNEISGIIFPQERQPDPQPQERGIVIDFAAFQRGPVS